MKWITFALISLLVLNVLADYKGLGVDSISTDTLKKYAPPTLNPVMTNKLKKMFDVTSPGMGMLSADKKTLFFTWRVTGISHIWKINGPQKFPVQLTSGSDAVTLNDVSTDGKFLIISKDTNGEENPGIYKLDLASGPITELYRKAKVQSKYDFITADSKTIYFSANDTKVDSFNIYKMYLASGEKMMIYEGNGNWGIADQRENGKELLLYKATGSKTSEFYTYDQVTKKLEPVIGVDEKGEFEVSFAATKGEYLVLTPKAEFKKLYLYVPAKSKNLIPLTDDKLKYDVSGFSINEKRTRITYNINRDGYTKLFAIDAKNYKTIPMPQFKGADHVFSGYTSRDGSITMLGMNSAQSPRISYSYN